MNKQLLLLFIIAITFLPFSPVRSQDHPMLHFTVEDGLPSNTIYNVFKDSKGYLWIATDKGVARYNGRKFEIFTSFDGLADNEVFFFREDGYGRIWMATYNGSLCYYKDGFFHNAANTPLLKMPFKSSYIKSIDISKDSTVTFGFFDPRILLNISKDKAYYSYLKTAYGDFETRTIYYKKKSTPDSYEFIGNTGVAIIDTAGHLKQYTPRLINGIFKMTFSQDQFYACDQDSLFSDDLRTIRALPKGMYDQYIMVCYSYDNNFFMGTNNGLYINDTARVLSGSKVSTITNDDKGNYWVGALNSGLYCMKKDLRSRIYKNYYTGQVKYAISKDDHIFFTTTGNDLYAFEQKAPRYIFDYKKQKKGDYTYPNNEAHFIDDSHNYYSIYNSDLVIINDILAPHPLIKVYGFPDRYSKEVKSIYPIADSLYIITSNDLLRVNKGELKPSLPATIYFMKDTAISDRIFGADKDRDIVWFSTISQVYKVERGITKAQFAFKHLAFKALKIVGNYLLGYTQDNKLVVCNNIEGNVSISTIPDQNCIWNKIYALDTNHILISTNNFYRLITLSPSTDTPRYSIFTVESPFLPLEAEAICADAGNCYFFKNGEVTSLDIKGLYIKPEPVRLNFNALKTDKRSIAIDSVIQLPYYESKNITISFSSLFFSGNEVFYQYSVSRHNIDHWRNLKSEELNLFNLGYGTYTIKIRARSISSEYCEPVVFTLQIFRPYWATWWFITLASCIAITILVVAIRYRIGIVVSRKEKENQSKIVAVKAEYKALNALMNPHFIFNTLNNVQSLVNDNNKMAANEYLRVFADLIRQNMHNISKELIPLQKEMDLVTNYLLLEKLRFEEKLNYTINIDENLDLSDILIPPLLIQPLVENAIKHGILNLKKDNGQVCVNIYERNEYLFIEVKDNGVGISHAQNAKASGHESFGIDNIKKRIQQLSIIQEKEISFHMEEEIDARDKMQWTIVTISMPFSE